MKEFSLSFAYYKDLVLINTMYKCMSTQIFYIHVLTTLLSLATATNCLQHGDERRIMPRIWIKEGNKGNKKSTHKKKVEMEEERNNYSRNKYTNKKHASNNNDKKQPNSDKSTITPPTTTTITSTNT